MDRLEAMRVFVAASMPVASQARVGGSVTPRPR